MHSGNARPVKRVFRPAVNAARDGAEEVLHRKRGAHQVMGLHLGHGDQQAGAQNGVGKVQFPQARELGPGRHVGDVVEVQIDEQVFEPGNRPEVSGGLGEIQGIAAVPGTFGDADAGRPGGEEGFIGGVDQKRVGIDGGSGLELHQVGFEDHSKAAHVQAVASQNPPHGIVEALIVSRAHDGDLGRSSRRGRGATGLAAGQQRGAGRPRNPFASGRFRVHASAPEEVAALLGRGHHHIQRSFRNGAVMEAGGGAVSRGKPAMDPQAEAEPVHGVGGPALRQEALRHRQGAVDLGRPDPAQSRQCQAGSFRIGTRGIPQGAGGSVIPAAIVAGSAQQELAAGVNAVADLR